MIGPELTPQLVEETFTACLPADGLAPAGDLVVVDGIMSRAAFDSARLDEHAGVIGAMLRQLPSQFGPAGGGWSFLNACMTADGSLWTGEHRVVDHLMMLGMATGKAHLMLPRDLWGALPGGMPYYRVDQ